VNGTLRPKSVGCANPGTNIIVIEGLGFVRLSSLSYKFRARISPKDHRGLTEGIPATLDHALSSAELRGSLSTDCRSMRND
jgi:hypothetical protein